MKLSDAREAYHDHTKALSEVNRKIAFAGIALIWIFKGESGAVQTIPKPLLLPDFLLVVSLACDFGQYVSASLSWGTFHRVMERKLKSKDREFLAPSWLNWPAILFFWGKVIACAFAYVLIINWIRQRVPW
jgi:hypothetical protein